jgi:predicted enzyme related to lactoylglutathione lyase
MDHAPGTPSWVELSSPDIDASTAFYGALLGWEATAPGPAEETGGYRLFQQAGQNVAGLMGHMQEGQPTVWSTYVSVDDADATVERAKAAGGTVLVEPMEVMDLGRMAFVTDPAGAAIGIWRPRAFAGADLVNEPNSLCWNEVLTRDAEAGKAFYPAVFGWTAGRPQFEGAPESYVVWELDGSPVGGMMTLNDDFFGPDVPSYWGVCFAVADCGVTVDAARELGATVTFGPMDMPIGRFANIIDPQGASFSIMQPAPQA